MLHTKKFCITISIVEKIKNNCNTLTYNYKNKHVRIGTIYRHVNLPKKIFFY